MKVYLGCSSLGCSCGTSCSCCWLRVTASILNGKLIAMALEAMFHKALEYGKSIHEAKGDT